MALNFGYLVGTDNGDSVKAIEAIKRTDQVNWLTCKRDVVGYGLVGASRYTLFGLSLEVAAS